MIAARELTHPRVLLGFLDKYPLRLCLMDLKDLLNMFQPIQLSNAFNVFAMFACRWLCSITEINLLRVGWHNELRKCQCFAIAHSDAIQHNLKLPDDAYCVMFVWDVRIDRCTLGNRCYKLWPDYLCAGAHLLCTLLVWVRGLPNLFRRLCRPQIYTKSWATGGVQVFQILVTFRCHLN